ncbi:unnamed protein product [Larinioides sclopetarius]|uniref:Uncharacterized protein n=1 Tax=Larinioides sclopetarius TaxID=280406 RepID=A0AAV2BCK6_9ARAC
MCYATDDPDSLNNVWRVWIPEFRRYYPASTGFCLLGLKRDTRLDEMTVDGVTVAKERAKILHERFEFCGDYLECSVEENPQHARHCMDLLITDALYNWR